MDVNSKTIQAMLARKGWTKSNLAEKAGISRQSVSVILARGTCSTVNAGKIADALECDVTEIIKED